MRNIDTYGPCLIIIEEHFEFETFFGVVHAYLYIMGPASRAHNPVVKIQPFFLHSGGWSPNWVHSARRPFIGLLYLPRVIVRMKNLVE
jgi:hypothetical protein